MVYIVTLSVVDEFLVQASTQAQQGRHSENGNQIYKINRIIRIEKALCRIMLKMSDSRLSAVQVW